MITIQKSKTADTRSCYFANYVAADIVELSRIIEKTLGYPEEQKE